MLNKKGIAELALIVIIVIIIIAIGSFINFTNRECNGNNDCREDQYCGSDYSCHNIPVIKKEPKVTNINLLPAAFVLGIAGIIITIILRFDKLAPHFKRKPKKEKPYYESVKTDI